MKKYLLMLIILLALCSCSKKSDIITVPDEDISWNSPSNSWAVVTDPYAAFKVNPLWNSATTDHCRLGDVLLIEGCAILNSRTIKNTKETWYKFKSGWLAESSIQVYQNMHKAKKAAESLTK